MKTNEHPKLTSSSNKKALSKKFPVVRVDWVDSATLCDHWIPRDEMLKDPDGVPPHIVSVGILLRQNKDHVLLTRGIDTMDYPMMMGAFVIPVGCIKKIRRLK
ncbi:MAG: hypothetical protein KGJ90_03830 [Patescibacteria group bacterium]|nr:hypothetical protein [Patescibacteria group bacterium]